jgi:hypothetical protein
VFESTTARKLGPAVVAAALLSLLAVAPARGQHAAGSVVSAEGQYQALPPMQAPPTAIRVGLPMPQFNASGELFVQPNVGSAGVGGIGAANGAALGNGSWGVQPASGTQPVESLPAPLSGQQPGYSYQWLPDPAATPANNSVLPGGLLSGDPADVLWPTGEPVIPWEEFAVIKNRPRSPTGEAGIGRERVMCAPFEIDITQPFGNMLLRADAVYNLTEPDRAEYFWGRPGKGPLLPETGVDYQDMRFRLELGGGAFSLATDIPVRFLNPEVNGNNGGLSDIQLVQKTLLMNGQRWQMTQILRTIFNSGNARKGLGTGHVSMEPGFLCRFKVNELTYLHSQWELRFPIAGDPMYSGPSFTWGVGVSHLWYESDTFAMIPTLEFINTYIMDGQVTPPGSPVPVDVRGDGIYNLGPGLRTVWDTGGDLGIVELGVNSFFAVGSDGWFDAMFRFDMRFVF